MTAATAPRICQLMHYDPANPLIVQGDRTVLVEVDNPKYAEARDALAPFAELEKSPEHIHTYRLTPLSLWNAASSGLDAACRAGRDRRSCRRAAGLSPRLIRVGLHLHSRYSPDSITPLEKIVARARELGLERVALTDHEKYFRIGSCCHYRNDFD